jgi:phospholipid/cholesterol/gamma-HCH transport system substrate-binding protein
MSGSDMKFSQLKVGMLALIGLTIFIFFILIVGSRDNLFGDNYDIKMFVSDSEGLVTGSKVSMGGLKVGYVKAMRFAGRDGEKGVEITLRIEEKYSELITRTSEAMIKSVGMLGDRYVHLTIGDSSEPPIREGDFINVETAFSLENAGDDINSVITNLNKNLVNLTALTDSMRAGKGVAGRLLVENDLAIRLDQTVNNLYQISTAVKQGSGTLGKLVAEDRLYKSLNKVSRNFETITGGILSGQGTMGKLFNEDSLYVNLKASSSKLDSLLSKTGRDSSTMGQLLSDGSLYRAILHTTENLNALVKDIREHPERYVKVTVF